MALKQKLVVVLERSYIISRGITEIIDNYPGIEIVNFDAIDQLIDYLERYEPDAVFLNPEMLSGNPDLAEKLFINKREAMFIALLRIFHSNFAYRNKFDQLISVETIKEKVNEFMEEVLFINKKKAKTLAHSSLLSERETEVLKLITIGYTNKVIAGKLFISTHTVVSHRKNISAKLGIKTLAGLTVYAILNNLIPKDVIR